MFIILTYFGGYMLTREQCISSLICFADSRAYDIDRDDLVASTETQLLAAVFELDMGGLPRLVHDIRQRKLTATPPLTSVQIQNRLMRLAHEALAGTSVRSPNSRQSS